MRACVRDDMLRSCVRELHLHPEGATQPPAEQLEGDGAFIFLRI